MPLVSDASATPVPGDQLASNDTRRGRHKIFLGMAAGAGKTYRMLQEGQAEAEAGRDVVIGYLEPHGRIDTVAQAQNLELIPRRRVSYRDTELEEMDLPAILRRRPELCLIDELAHSNAPGSVAPSIPTLPNTARRNRHASVAPISWTTT